MCVIKRTYPCRDLRVRAHAAEPPVSRRDGRPGRGPLDARQLSDHVFLESTDLCWALMEYRAGTYRRCWINQLIANIKCPPQITVAHAARAYYKRLAMHTVATALRGRFEQAVVEGVTWVPIPTSTRAGGADHDDRLVQVLWMAFGDYDLDLRPLLTQTRSTPPDHQADRRLSTAELYQLLELDQSAARAKPLRQRIVLFDDLLTTGKHFKCCQRRIREFAAGIPIVGCFIARRVLPHR